MDRDSGSWNSFESSYTDLMEIGIPGLVGFVIASGDNLVHPV